MKLPETGTGSASSAGPGFINSVFFEAQDLARETGADRQPVDRDRHETARTAHGAMASGFIQPRSSYICIDRKSAVAPSSQEVNS